MLGSDLQQEIRSGDVQWLGKSKTALTAQRLLNLPVVGKGGVWPTDSVVAMPAAWASGCKGRMLLATESFLDSVDRGSFVESRLADVL